MRLRQLEKEFGGAIRLDWRSFLLRPVPGEIPRKLDEFREYTKKWARPAADVDAGEFREWSTEEGPPTHSMPPHLVAKAAAELGDDAFHAIHDRLLHAYFAENRDISNGNVLLEMWRECGLPEEAFQRAMAPDIADKVIEEHNEAVEIGVNGVPAVRIEGNEAAAVGAQPIELYRRWFQKMLDQR